MILFNMFIAALLEAYDEVYKGDESAVNRFQLLDI